MIKEVDGNLLTYPGLQVIGHQVNALAVMGAGVAKQIKARWPDVYKSYVRYCKRYPDAHNILGKVQFCEAEDGKYVANLFGEYSFCESIAPYEEGGKPRHTDYDALKEIKHYSAVLDEYFNTKVAVALNKKDIDECSSEEVIEVFNNIMDVRDFALDIVGKIKR